MIFNAVVALAFAATAFAQGGPAPSSPNKVGCMTKADCGYGQICTHNICADLSTVGCMTDDDCGNGQVCGAHNICVQMAPTTTVWTMTTWTSTVTTCDNGKCHPCTVCPIYTCIGNACQKCDTCVHTSPAPAPPAPTITIIECAECEGGYKTSTCYPDVTTTITACNTCKTPVKPTTSPCTTPVVPVTTPCTTPVVPVTTPCTTPVVPVTTPCTTTKAVPTLPIFVSGAERAHIAYGALVGAVAIAAFML